MPYERIIFEKGEGIATITLNRPDALNAWNEQMTEETIAAIREVSRDEDIRVLIVTGAGQAFSSGADVGRLEDTFLKGKTPIVETGVGRWMLGKPAAITVALELRNLGKPVIAAVNGAAVGVGLSVALACDVRIASEDARFIAAWVKRGLVPDGGGSYLLPRLVGPGMAAKLIFTGDAIDAKEAARIGMADEVVSQRDLMKAAKELARRIAQNPPLALKMAKQTLYRGIDESDLESQIDYEIYLQYALFNTEDFKEGLKSFMEKRNPKFVGR